MRCCQVKGGERPERANAPSGAHEGAVEGEKCRGASRKQDKHNLRGGCERGNYGAVSVQGPT